MRTVRLLLLAGLLGVVPSLAAAQPAARPERPADAPLVTDTELALGRRLVDLLDLPGVAAAGVRLAMDQQMQMQPELAPYRDVLEEWAVNLFRGTDAADAFARLYAESFTEGELRHLVTFFESASGRRLAAEQASIAARAGELGQALAEAGSDDLRARLEKAMANPTRKPKRP